MKSNDGVNFNSIGIISASANNGASKQYSFTDNDLLQQKHYYRLKQVDVDGSFVLSNIIVLTNKGDKQNTLIFPNPVKNSATIIFKEPVPANEPFLLFNSIGQLVDRIIISGRSAQVNLSGKVAGLYLLVNHKLGLTVKLHKVAE